MSGVFSAAAVLAAAPEEARATTIAKLDRLDVSDPNPGYSPSYPSELNFNGSDLGNYFENVSGFASEPGNGYAWFDHADLYTGETSYRVKQGLFEFKTATDGNEDWMTAVFQAPAPYTDTVSWFLQAGAGGETFTVGVEYDPYGNGKVVFTYSGGHVGNNALTPLSQVIGTLSADDFVSIGLKMFDEGSETRVKAYYHLGNTLDIGSYSSVTANHYVVSGNEGYAALVGVKSGALTEGGGGGGGGGGGPAPEPSSVALAVAGIATLIGRRRLTARRSRAA